MIHNETGLCVTFNGEIYNHLTLRADLQAAGFTFRTRCDTEVLLAAYAVWGETMIERLEGMFAFAIYDPRDGTLFLARDRAGEKPLLFAEANDGAFLFGSELKALLAWPNFKPRPKLGAVNCFLAMQYVAGPGTIFDGVEHLPPAHHMRINRAGQRKISRYWSAPRAGEMTRRPIMEYVGPLRETHRAAVGRQLMSDVPLGIFLSGGLDSSSIVAAASENGVRHPKSYTIGFLDDSIDERTAAREVADFFNTDHTERLAAGPFRETIERIAWHTDQPFSDPAVVPTYMLSELASRHVKVALSGDGGDEILLGYPRYIGAHVTSRLEVLPARLRWLIAVTGNLLPVGESRVRFLRYVRRLLIEANKGEAQRYADWTMVFGEEDRRSLYVGEMASVAAGDCLKQIADHLKMGQSAIERAAQFDFSIYLPDDLLYKTDLMSMAHGLEVRCPFLDRELVELSMRIPVTRRMPALETKWLLRAAYDSDLPRRILTRGKQGLSVPLAEWMAGDMREIVEDCLSEESVRRRGLFDPAKVGEMLRHTLAGSHDYKYRVWALMWLELWFRNWVDGDGLARGESSTQPVVR